MERNGLHETRFAFYSTRTRYVIHSRRRNVGGGLALYQANGGLRRGVGPLRLRGIPYGAETRQPDLWSPPRMRRTTPNTSAPSRSGAPRTPAGSLGAGA